MNKSANTEYIEATNDLEQFGAILCGVIKEILIKAGVQVNSINHRVKDFESVSRKLSVRSERYLSISELTDLLGVRIITYFPKDVDKVANVITKEFDVDEGNSVDKRKQLEVDRFGYLSFHYVLSLKLPRKKLIEYERFESKCFELQIRSILQHAWAEIEHDLGYKDKKTLPEEVKRKFSQLAALLEIADDQFEGLRDEIVRYKKLVDATIKTAPQTLNIDQSTVIAALQSEKSLIELDRVVANAANSDLKQVPDPLYASREAVELNELGITDIATLIKYAKAYKPYVEKFAESWFKREAPANKRVPTTFNRGIGLFYLNYALAAQRNEIELEKWGLGIKNRHDGLLSEVRSTWGKVVAEIGLPPQIK